MAEKKLNIAMLGHKHVLSREGGIEIVVNELATRMAAKGHSVTCYDRHTQHVAGDTPLDSRREVAGVRIVPVWTIEKKGLAAMTSSLSAAWKATWGNYDVVHIHAEGPAAMSWLPKIRHKRVIVTVHGLDWARAKWGGFATKYIKWGEKQAVKHADQIIVLSRGVQEYFEKTYGRRTVFIPNGVSRPTLAPAQLITEKWGLEKDSYVLFLGRIVPEKGLRYLVHAWKNIKTDKKLVIAGGSSDTETFMDELKSMAGNDVIFTGFQQGRVLEELYSNPNASLVIIGGGIQLEELREYVRGKENVYLLGQIIDGVIKYFMACDVFALPSEGGLSLNQAMICSKPLIASSADGTELDLIKDGKNGFLFEEGDINSLAEKISQIISTPGLSESMGAYSRMIIDNRVNEINFYHNLKRCLDSVNRY